jgi:hypothetical protein
MTAKRRILVVLDRLFHLNGLPRAVASFQARAVVRAARSGDAFALQAERRLAAPLPAPGGRPTKRDRRRMDRWR